MAQNLAPTSMLNALEQLKEVLVEEMAELKLEEVRDNWIVEAIWEDMGGK